MDLGLAGRVALIAASSKGLGWAIANGLAAEGARVMISGCDEASLEDTAGEIREATNAVVDHQRADLTRAEDIRALVERTAERFGGLDILINHRRRTTCRDLRRCPRRGLARRLQAELNERNPVRPRSFATHEGAERGTRRQRRRYGFALC